MQIALKAALKELTALFLTKDVKKEKKYYVALHSLSIITACLSASEASSHASGMAPGMAATAMNRHSW